MSALDKMAEAYWNAFRRGFGKVGGPVNEYPTWKKGPKSVTSETERCMRHAVEILREDFDKNKIAGPFFDDLFPDRPAERSAARTANDDAMAGKLK